jgi:hypothetical protein
VKMAGILPVRISSLLRVLLVFCIAEFAFSQATPYLLDSLPLSFYPDIPQPQSLQELLDSSYTDHEEDFVCTGPGSYSIDLRGVTQVVNASITFKNIGNVDISNPWLVANGKCNWYDTPSIVAEALEGETEPKRRAFRLWKFVRNNRYHWSPAEAGNEVHDPVKLFNVYGCGLCDDSATNEECLFKVAGFASARCWALCGHVVAEVFYGSDWHMLDPDLNVFYPERDNETVASVNDCANDGWLVSRVSGSSIEQLYTTTEDNSIFQNSWTTAHTMAMWLRPGESLERAWYNWGKYHDNCYYQEPPRYGNGLLTYEPDLRQNLFRSGFQMVSNIESFADTGTTPNLHLADAKDPGVLICKMESPYVLVGGKLITEYFLQCSSDTLQVAFSKTGGEWTTLSFASGPSSGTLDLDLDSCIAPGSSWACYSFFVRMTINGWKNTSAGIDQFSLAGDVQLAPGSLPSLEAGIVNSLCYTSAGSAGEQLQITHKWRDRNYIPAPSRIENPIYPDDGATVPHDHPTLCWQEALTSSTIISHEIMVSWGVPGVLPVTPLTWKETGSAANSWAVPSGWLLPGRQYFWRVRAKSQELLWGDWSPAWRFTVNELTRVEDWTCY